MLRTSLSPSIERVPLSRRLNNSRPPITTVLTPMEAREHVAGYGSIHNTLGAAVAHLDLALARLDWLFAHASREDYETLDTAIEHVRRARYGTRAASMTMEQEGEREMVDIVADTWG